MEHSVAYYKKCILVWGGWLLWVLLIQFPLLDSATYFFMGKSVSIPATIAFQYFWHSAPGLFFAILNNIIHEVHLMMEWLRQDDNETISYDDIKRQKQKD